MSGGRLAEGADPAHLRAGQCGNTTLCACEFCLHLACGRSVFGRQFPEERVGIGCAAEWLPVIGTRHGEPFLRPGGGFDHILRGHAILESLRAVAAPNDALNAGFGREINADPAGAAVADPTVVIANHALVKMFELVNRMAGQCAGSAHLRAIRCQGQVLAGFVVDFEFINARL